MRNSLKSKSLSLWIIAALVIVVVIGLIVWRLSIPTPTPIKREVTAQVKLVIGEPFAQMVKDSTPGVIDPTTPYTSAYKYTKEDARLVFTDPQYGFKTPPSSMKYFTIWYDAGVIDIVEFYPQLEPLSLDDALNVIFDLQNQWRKGKWTLTRPGDSPAYEDTPAEKAQARKNGSPTTYWSAGDKYQIMLFLQRVKDPTPGQERYVINMSIAKPWTLKE